MIDSDKRDVEIEKLRKETERLTKINISLNKEVDKLRGEKDDHSQVEYEYREDIRKLKVSNFRLYGALQKAITSFDELVSNSTGVYGLHLNGVNAPWDDLLWGGNLEEWTEGIWDAREVLVAAKEGK